MYLSVVQLTGRGQTIDVADGISAESLNQHYAHISTDINYQSPRRKHTAACRCTDVVTEWQVFNILDKLPKTATGLDNLPAWSLRLGAPAFCKPIACLFNKSISL